MTVSISGPITAKSPDRGSNLTAGPSSGLARSAGSGCFHACYRMFRQKIDIRAAVISAESQKRADLKISLVVQRQIPGNAGFEEACDHRNSPISLLQDWNMVCRRVDQAKGILSLNPLAFGNSQDGHSRTRFSIRQCRYLLENWSCCGLLEPGENRVWTGRRVGRDFFEGFQ